MFFKPIIDLWGVERLADALDLPRKNVRRWIDYDSIPAVWFGPLVEAAQAAGHQHVTLKVLAQRALARRQAMNTARDKGAKALKASRSSRSRAA